MPCLCRSIRKLHHVPIVQRAERPTTHSGSLLAGFGNRDTGERFKIPAKLLPSVPEPVAGRGRFKGAMLGIGPKVAHND